MSNKQNKDIDVLSVGLAVVDVMGKAIDEVPEWSHLGTFDHIEHHIGGCAINTGVDLVKLGCKVAVGACIGRDGAGAFIRSGLEKEGADTAGLVEVDESSTSYTFVMIGSDGRRRYLHHVGANARLTDGHIADALLERARILHVGGSFLMPAFDGEATARLLARAQAKGVLTSLDTAFNPNVDARALIEPCLPHLDIFIPSIEEAEAITGESDPEVILDKLGKLSGHPIAILGIKLGSEGCLIRAEGQTHKLPVYKVEVIDASGAGDAFMAGFLYGTLKEWSIEERMQFGNATAAHAIGAIGCSTGIKPAEDISSFMRERQTK